MTETINSEILGTLTRENPNYDFWNSESFPVPFFDGKAMQMVYVCSPEADQSFISEADSALANFLKKSNTDREEISEAVYRLCRDYIELIGLKETIELFEALEDLQDWQRQVIEQQGPLLKIDSSAEIWNFVDSQEIHLVQAAAAGETHMYVQILCDCAWDEEHGIQLVFRDGVNLVRISEQDGDPLERA